MIQRVLTHSDSAVIPLVGGATWITTPITWKPLPIRATWKMECISEGGMVLVQKEKSYRTFVLKKGRWASVYIEYWNIHAWQINHIWFIRKLSLEKLSFYPDNAFGCHFGSSFQVEKQQLVPVSSAGRWKFGGTCTYEVWPAGREIVRRSRPSQEEDGLDLKPILCLCRRNVISHYSTTCIKYVSTTLSKYIIAMRTRTGQVRAYSHSRARLLFTS